MKLSEIKVGQKYRSKSTGQILKVTRVDNGVVVGDVKAYRVDVFLTSDLLPLTPTCFEELYEGYEFIDEDEETMTVCFCNKFLSIVIGEGGHPYIYSKSEFDECFPEVYFQPKEPKEYSMDEIAKALGVSVEKLKIKKE